MRGSTRFFLKDRESRLLLERCGEELRFDPRKSLGVKVRVEALGFVEGSIYLLNGKPLIFQRCGKLYPTLFYEGFIKTLPRVTVDLGAVPHICGGADVMVPGIRRVEGVFDKGSYVVVIDERYEKPLALGLSVLSAESIKSAKAGKAVEVFHYVGDRVWEAVKTL